MKLGTVKVILVLSHRWNVTPRRGDVPNPHVRAEIEKEIDIYMKVRSGMQVSQDILKQDRVNHTNELALLLKKSLFSLKQSGRLWRKQ